jgi:hypothetical protein
LVHTVVLRNDGRRGAVGVGAPITLWCTERGKPCKQAGVTPPPREEGERIHRTPQQTPRIPDGNWSEERIVQGGLKRMPEVAVKMVRENNKIQELEEGRELEMA